jgi:hypothetical protein
MVDLSAVMGLNEDNTKAGYIPEIIPTPRGSKINNPI